MWLLIASIFALVATYSWINNPGKNRNGTLALAFWALTFMIFVDHVIGWALEGAEGDFLEIGIEPFILSLCMIVPILAAWEFFVVVEKLGIKFVKPASSKDAETVEE